MLHRNHFIIIRNVCIYRFETESKIVTVSDETIPVVVNVTLTVANSLHISQQNAADHVEPPKISDDYIPSEGLPSGSQGPTKIVLNEHDYVPTISNEKLPSYTSKDGFYSKFESEEYDSADAIEKFTYKADTGSVHDDVTSLRISKVVSLRVSFALRFDNDSKRCFLFADW